MCIIYDLSVERAKRQGYKNLDINHLCEVMTKYLEVNPMPIKDKRILKDGMDIFACIFKKANTVELRQVASDFIRLYHKQFMSLE